MNEPFPARKGGVFSKRSGGGSDLWRGSLVGLANSLAALITFLLLPEIYDRTVEWIAHFTAAHYGADFVDFCKFAWLILLGCIIFFTARAGTVALVVSGGMTLALKFV
ncbi:hypothetical protein AUC70_05820 [Methyloceanibacter stevinii]|uniref:Uncharacterized protein n=1 Tax=Methyloceanibacter stevinii TaxID=1774970 RepID=A0A1E3VNU9_9HYPH|nr:hypothetical protein [Methyloceanibacter stevinii]ODR95215.1 hypothetical protein AUC70_05820 [Methyloceanibacter stevinii]